MLVVQNEHVAERCSDLCAWLRRENGPSPDGYNDMAIMALAERLNLTQVYTFDWHGFIRPTHCPALELLP